MNEIKKLGLMAVVGALVAALVAVLLVIIEKFFSFPILDLLETLPSIAGALFLYLLFLPDWRLVLTMALGVMLANTIGYVVRSWGESKP